MVVRISVVVAALVAFGGLSVAEDGLTAHPGDDRLARLVAQAEHLRPEVLEMALAAYERAEAAGDVTRPRLVIIDYELPSYEKRLWVIDVETDRVLFEEWVAHGMGRPRGSGGDLERAFSFSNSNGTRKSSLGLFVAAETYHGKHGYSLKLDGLEPGINDAARERAIVMHPAHYVTSDRAERRLVGRSWGCPAVRPKVSRELIDAIKGGSLLWVYYPDRSLLGQSRYLAPEQGEGATAESQRASPRATSAPAAGRADYRPLSSSGSPRGGLNSNGRFSPSITAASRPYTSREKITDPSGAGSAVQ
jgi:hypothetical protein